MFFAFLPLASFAQEVACPQKSVLYSRELFPEAMTVRRAMTMSCLSPGCVDSVTTVKIQTPEPLKIMPARFQNYQYYPLDPMHQSLFGNDPFPATTEQMVNHLVFDRR